MSPDWRWAQTHYEPVLVLFLKSQFMPMPIPQLSTKLLKVHGAHVRKWEGEGKGLLKWLFDDPTPPPLQSIPSHSKAFQGGAMQERSPCDTSPLQCEFATWTPLSCPAHLQKPLNDFCKWVPHRIYSCMASSCKSHFGFLLDCFCKQRPYRTPLLTDLQSHLNPSESAT